MFFVFFWDLIYFFRDMLLRLLQIDDNEIRVRLMRRAVEDFLSNPSSAGDSDISATGMSIIPQKAPCVGIIPRRSRLSAALA